jgi:hypothetical protein
MTENQFNGLLLFVILPLVIFFVVVGSAVIPRLLS